MKTHAQAVVIGGGLIGCSILYHLTKLGWRDVVLLERDELTSGSTWHAAAGTHGLHDTNNISRLQYYTMALYAELEAETGQSCGVHQPGGIYLACTKDRVHQLRIAASKARAFDAEFYEIGEDDVRELHPLVQMDGVLCAMYEPLAGHVDPSGVTHAYAAGARQRGAEIHRFAAVRETRADKGGWRVVTDQGEIHADYLINAAGLWAREVAQLAGVTLPLVPMEHQYLVTEEIPAIAELGRELPAIADRDYEYYMRQEGNGLLVGAYERDGRLWSENATPMDFGHDLLPPDLSRIEDNLMRACERVPVFAEAGVKKVINGPMIWSPDAAALLGPVPGLKNYFVCCGIIPGFSQSAGLGLTLAQWMIEGEPELDMFPWDVARFGDWANGKFATARAMDAYRSRFRIHFPLEERDAGRPLQTRPAYTKQKSRGAVFGFSFGWEHPQWFAREGDAQQDEFSFERPKWFDAVGEECMRTRESVGVIDVSNFAKYEISGKNALAWANDIFANYAPDKDGQTRLTPLLSPRAGIAGDFTIARFTAERLLMIGSGIAEEYHLRILARHLPAKGVVFRSLSRALCGFNIAGPNARALVEKLIDAPLPNDDLRFMQNRAVRVGGFDAALIRVSFSGDLGYEIYVAEQNQLALYDAIFNCGAEFNAVAVGSRALGSMRIEKGYGSWSREYSPEWRPNESNMAALVKPDKKTFLGKAAYLEVADLPPRQQLCIFSIDADNADASGGESIYLNGDYVGRVTSGGYGFFVKQSLALGYVNFDAVTPGGDYEIAVLGRAHRAKLLTEPPFDARGVRLRG